MSKAGVFLTVDITPEGHHQMSIEEKDEEGYGLGYRLHGPKYDGRSSNIVRHRISERDAESIRRYLDKATG